MIPLWRPLLLATILSVATHAAERRTALVIGNARYAKAPLRNPGNDADDVAQALERCGFSVIAKHDCSRRTMFAAIREFGDLLAEGGVGLFYYAGHAVQVNGRNYLVPVGADLHDEDEIRVECLDADLVVRKMAGAGNGLNIIMLDACRSNPFATRMRSQTRGLAVMQAAKGMLISFATAPGDVAADGQGRNGGFTAALLHHIHEPGLTVEAMLKRVRLDVMGTTGEKQVPWEHTSLTGDFHFFPLVAPAPASLRPAPKRPISVPDQVSVPGKVDVPTSRPGKEPTIPHEEDIEAAKEELRKRLLKIPHAREIEVTNEALSIVSRGGLLMLKRHRRLAFRDIREIRGFDSRGLYLTLRDGELWGYNFRAFVDKTYIFRDDLIAIDKALATLCTAAGNEGVGFGGRFDSMK